MKHLHSKNLAKKFSNDGKIAFPSSLYQDFSNPKQKTLYILQSEKYLYPEITRWIDVDNNEKTKIFSLYPNFQEQYSIVWNFDISKYGNDWINAAIDFYTESKKYFNENCSNYHLFYPQKNKQTKTERDNQFLHSIQKSTNEEISQKYGIEFNGNIDDLQQQLWNKELKRIHVFLDKTIDMLTQKLTPDVKLKNKPK